MQQYPKLLNAGWTGPVGKGRDAEPEIDLDTMLQLTAEAEVDGRKFDGVDLFLAAPHVPIDATDAEVDEIGRKIAAYDLAVGSIVATVWPYRGWGSASRGRGLLPRRAGVISRKRCGEN
jgi:hypothetical protein